MTKKSKKQPKLELQAAPEVKLVVKYDVSTAAGKLEDVEKSYNLSEQQASLDENQLLVAVASDLSKAKLHAQGKSVLSVNDSAALVTIKDMIKS